MIKRIVAPLFAAGIALAASAQKLPMPSPLGSVEQTIGLTKVTVTYSRPSAKGRAIFGGLVPFDKVWRTGANAATHFEVSDTVTIDGKQLPPGTYALFTMPGKSKWQVMFNRNAEQSGTSSYKTEEDVLQATAQAAACERTETFTIGFANVTMESADLELRWETTVVRLPIKADPADQAMANIEAALKEGQTTAGDLNRMARYCVDHEVRLKEAREWAQKSVDMEKHYWNLFTLALAQAKTDDRGGAESSAKEALELAQAEGDASMVAQINDKLKSWSGK